MRCAVDRRAGISAALVGIAVSVIGVQDLDGDADADADGDEDEDGAPPGAEADIDTHITKPPDSCALPVNVQVLGYLGLPLEYGTWQVAVASDANEGGAADDQHQRGISGEAMRCNARRARIAIATDNKCILVIQV